jgi:hypothetical protein
MSWTKVNNIQQTFNNFSVILTKCSRNLLKQQFDIVTNGVAIAGLTLAKYNALDFYRIKQKMRFYKISWYNTYISFNFINFHFLKVYCKTV